MPSDALYFGWFNQVMPLMSLSAGPLLHCLLRALSHPTAQGHLLMAIDGRGWKMSETILYIL